MLISEQTAVRIFFGIIAALAFGLVYWWRQRTRSGGLELSQSSRMLSDMVKTSDAPDVEDAIEVAASSALHAVADARKDK